MRRFIPFKNTMTSSEPGQKPTDKGVTEAKVQVKKIEYKHDERLEKTFECRVTQTQNRVTKAYAERRAKYSGVPDAFGVDKT